MNKFQIPQFPAVRGKFNDQDSYAEQAQSKIAEMLESDNNHQFGVVTCGMGGGYLVDFTEDEYQNHPIKLFAFLIKPEREYENAAEMIKDFWQCDVTEVQEMFDKDLEVDLSEIPVSYVFETQEEADEWLVDFNQEKED
jgi:hypothetical protein